MIITINGKYIVGTPKYLKTKIVCSTHADFSHISMIKQLLPPLIITKYELLHFNDVTLVFIERFSKLHLITIAIEYKLGTEMHLSQDDVTTLYHKFKNETICRICKYENYTEEQFVHEMYRTLDYNIAQSLDTLRLFCDGCSCVNVLKFNGKILKKWYYLHIRHDLVYKFISNFDFCECHDVVKTIDSEIGSIRSKLTDTRNKIIVMIMGITDINSLISSLHNDIIGVLVCHLIHNVNDMFMINHIKYTRWFRLNRI